MNPYPKLPAQVGQAVQQRLPAIQQKAAAAGVPAPAVKQRVMSAVQQRLPAAPRAPGVPTPGMPINGLLGRAMAQKRA